VHAGLRGMCSFNSISASPLATNSSTTWLGAMYPQGPPAALDCYVRMVGESLAGRIVFPEIRQRQPIWLIARLLEAVDDLPRYLGRAGPKPLLGWDQASRDRRAVCIVEGPLDVLTLQQWGVPGIAL